MYNTGESQLKGIEELVFDFLMFRKNKQALSSNEFRSECQYTKGWPIYNSSLDNSDTLKTYSYYSPQNYNTQNYINDEQPNEDSMDMDMETDMEADMEFMQQLFNEINKRLHAYVIEVINENEYEGSPIYDEQITREFIAQLVDQVLEKAAQGINEVEEINLEMERSYWGRPKLLRSAVETSILHELYGHRRPRYRRHRRQRHHGRHHHRHHDNNIRRYY